MGVDFTNPPATVLSPSKLAHVVLRTNKLAEMVKFYKDFLGSYSVFENEMLAFLTYDDEHHRIAIIGMPGTTAKEPNSCGLEHIAFSFDSLSDLLLSYRQRRAKGILPEWPVNHGPTTSIYYKDPDGNRLETQVDNFENPDDATEFMKSKEFAINPIGTDFDPEELIARLEGGETEKALMKRVPSGPRELPLGF
ncbi:putative Glyoxalase/Bleomycin resistance protein/Dihydroxybiphenyl dioxygenase [Seiridium unicorne]|uniref:Glyoxalase/Bleomycin resistance protein/Dihydroxybiphenyl dioxygenase n=1 Tax=Seiridium unicorne TaxID=138068 RepID=A0ABR2V818_9PEZI